MAAPLRTAVVAVALLLCVTAGGGATKAADKCMTRAEAKTMYRGAYLYWHRQGGKRCWSNRRGGRASMPHRPPRQRQAARTDVLQTVGATASARLPPMPPMAAPPEVAGLMPPWWLQPVAVLDAPRLAWVAQARAVDADFEPGPTFTTFDGPQPDVWPRLDEPASTGGIVVVVMSGFLAMALGLVLWRRQLGRVRITT